MKLKKFNVIDIETDGLDVDDAINWIGILTFDSQDDDGEYIILNPKEDDISILEETSECINIFHNGKFDSKMILHQLGYDIKVDHDTMILTYLSSYASDMIENRRGWLTLKNAAKRLLNAPDWDVGINVKTSKSRADVEEYLKGDLYWTRQLFEYFKLSFDKRDWKTYRLVIDTSMVYRDIELNGLPIDEELLAETKLTYEEKLKECDDKLAKYANINWNSPKQLQDLLYKDLGLPIPEKTDSGQPSTGVSALSKLKGKHEIVDLILKRREVDKALTFLVDWSNRAKDGYIYANFNLTTTVTGRTSCNNPNLQQVPRNKDLKTLFRSIDPDWEFVQLDYSQAELRTAGVVGKVSKIKELYNQGVDLHTNMAAKVAGIDPSEVTKEQRTAAKAINFGYLYGMQPASFVEYAALSYGQTFSFEEATHIRKAFFKEYHELPRYYKDTQDELMQNGFVTSIMGRRYKVSYKALYFPDQRQKYMRRIINFPVQSAASDIILCALCEIRSTFPQTLVKICATVHDSVILLVKKNKDFHDNVLKIQSIMQHPKRVGSMLTVKWDVPLVADIECGPWGKGIDLEEYCEIHAEELEG
jgi:DNA polymerase-1